jgi:hypothetical protein
VLCTVPSVKFSVALDVRLACAEGLAGPNTIATEDASIDLSRSMLLLLMVFNDPANPVLPGKEEQKRDLLYYLRLI